MSKRVYGKSFGFSASWHNDANVTKKAALFWKAAFIYDPHLVLSKSSVLLLQLCPGDLIGFFAEIGR